MGSRFVSDGVVPELCSAKRLFKLLVLPIMNSELVVLLKI